MTEHSRSTVDYSIVIPVYFNEGALSETMASLRTEVIEKNPQLKAEVIFVSASGRPKPRIAPSPVTGKAI